MVDTVERLAGRVPRRARPPARVRRRRVLPARRAARSPPPTTYEGFPHARERHRHGPHVRGRGARRARGRRRRRPASAPGFFAWVDGAPAEGYRAPRDRRRRPRPRSVAPRPRRDAPDRDPHRRATARAVLEPLARPSCAGADVRARCPVANGFFGGNIGVTGLLAGADVAPRARRPSPSGDRYLLPDVVPLAGPVPRRHHPRRPAPRRSRSSPTDGAVAAPRCAEPRRPMDVGSMTPSCPSSPSSAGRTSASRRS